MTKEPIPLKPLNIKTLQRAIKTLFIT